MDFRKLDDIGDVIAERVLKWPVDGGEPQDVTVRLGRPQPDDHDGYFCPFEILGIGPRKVRCAFGVDAFQSLQLVLRMISVVLHCSRSDAAPGMYFLEPGDDLGFPEEAD